MSINANDEGKCQQAKKMGKKQERIQDGIEQAWPRRGQRATNGPPIISNMKINSNMIIIFKHDY